MFGRYPSEKDAKELISLGVTIFPNLTEKEEREERNLESYWNYDYGNANIRFLSFPIVEKFVPTNVENFRKCIDKIVSHLQEGEKLYIHCKHGRGRSALVANIILQEWLQDNEGYYIARELIYRGHRNGHGCEKGWKNVELPPHPIQKNFAKMYRVKPKIETFDYSEESNE